MLAFYPFAMGKSLPIYRKGIQKFSTIITRKSLQSGIMQGRNEWSLSSSLSFVFFQPGSHSHLKLNGCVISALHLPFPQSTFSHILSVIHKKTPKYMHISMSIYVCLSDRERDWRTKERRKSRSQVIKISKSSRG